MIHHARGQIPSSSEEDLRTVANAITLLRIIISLLLFCAAAYQRSAMLNLAGLAVYWVGDVADGFLARRLNQTSSFGAFLDPVADKFLVCACVLVLVHLQRADVFVALIIIGREIAISALREWMAQLGQSKGVAVAFIGKLKTTMQMIAIIVLLLYENIIPGISTPIVGTICIWIAAVLTLWSMVYYWRLAAPHLKP